MSPHSPVEIPHEHPTEDREWEKEATERLNALGLECKGKEVFKVPPDEDIRLKFGSIRQPIEPEGLLFRLDLPEDEELPNKKGVNIFLFQYPGTNEYKVIINADVGALNNWQYGKGNGLLFAYNINTWFRLPLNLALKHIESFVKHYRAHDPENRHTYTTQTGQHGGYTPLHIEMHDDPEYKEVEDATQEKLRAMWALKEQKEGGKQEESPVKATKLTFMDRMKAIFHLN